VGLQDPVENLLKGRGVITEQLKNGGTHHKGGNTSWPGGSWTLMRSKGQVEEKRFHHVVEATRD